MILCLHQGSCELVGAGGGLHAALDTLQAGDHLIDGHSLRQQRDTLRVAAAPADKTDVGNDVIIDLKKDLACADTARFIFVLHCVFLLCFFLIISKETGFASPLV